jgi:hypothetical protein
MEYQIKKLLNETNLTEIILNYNLLEKKMNELEKKIIRLDQNKEIQSKDIKLNDSTIKKLQELIDATTNDKIKNLLIEDLIEIHEEITNLITCLKD